MAKDKTTEAVSEPVADADKALSAPQPGTGDTPKDGLENRPTLAQKIANRLGYGISIASELLKKADAEALEGTIDDLTNDQLAERLEPAKKS
jgi:hypothetical protein